MALQNTQNTVSGTPSGGSIVSSMGNSLLDAIDRISNVGTRITTSIGGAAMDSLNVYGSFRDRLRTLGLIKEDDAAIPQQTMPSNMIDSGSDFFSDPARVQKAIVWATVISVAGVGLYYFVKKK